MTLFTSLGLAAAMFILAVTPGPGVFATVSKALSSSFRRTVPLAMGIVAGDLIFLLLAIYGLSSIAESFETLFTAIKYLGAIYLIWLGVKLWRLKGLPSDVIESQVLSTKHSFFAGISLTLGNPKSVLFYLGFLPTFVNLNSLTTNDIIIVVTITFFVITTVMLSYAYTAARAKLLFQSPRAQNKLNKTAGSVMIGTGALLLSKV